MRLIGRVVPSVSPGSRQILPHREGVVAMPAMNSQDPFPDSLRDSSVGEIGNSAPASGFPVGSSSGHSLTIGRAWELILDQLLVLTHATGATIAVRERGRYVSKASAGEAPPVDALANHENGLVAECIQTNDTVVCSDTQHDPRVDPTMCRLLRLGSLVVTPLHQQELIEGLICVSSPHSFAFDENTLITLTAIAGAIELILADRDDEANSGNVPSFSFQNSPAATQFPPSRSFARAFARAMADSSGAVAQDNLEIESVGGSMSAAELFAAAGTLRADIASVKEVLDQDRPTRELKPEIAEVVAALPPENCQVQVTDTIASEVPGAQPPPASVPKPASKRDASIEPLPQVPATTIKKGAATPPVVRESAIQTVAEEPAPATMRGAKAGPSLSDIRSFAKPVPTNAQFARTSVKLRTLGIALACLLLIAAIAGFARWRYRLSSSATTQSKTASVSSEAQPPAPVVSPAVPPVTETEIAAETKPRQTLGKNQAAEPRTPATFAVGTASPPTQSESLPRSATQKVEETAAPSTQTPTPKALVLPSSASPPKTVVQENISPPPLSSAVNVDSTMALNSLVVPVKSAVPVLSPRVDASSVMLAVRHDPKAVFVAAKPLSQNYPAYPDAARSSHRQGSVVLQATVGPNGRVSQVRVVDGDSTLSAAAASAVQSWTYEPARIDGHPVESTVLVTMNFRISQ